MLYKTLCSIIVKGERVPRGREIELDEETAKNLVDQVYPVSGIPTPKTEKEPEKALDQMSHAELKAKAKELGIKTKGSIADLVERITLHAPEPKMIDHVVTEEDLVNNPALVEEGVHVGDTIQVPEEEETN